MPDSRVYDSDLSVRAAIHLLMTTGMEQSDSVIELDDDEVVLPGDHPGSAD